MPTPAPTYIGWNPTIIPQKSACFICLVREKIGTANDTWRNSKLSSIVSDALFKSVCVRVDYTSSPRSRSFWPPLTARPSCGHVCGKRKSRPRRIPARDKGTYHARGLRPSRTQVLAFGASYIRVPPAGSFCIRVSARHPGGCPPPAPRRSCRTRASRARSRRPRSPTGITGTCAWTSGLQSVYECDVIARVGASVSVRVNVLEILGNAS